MAHITAYGGGETLVLVFKAISMLMNGQTGKLYQPLMLIGGMIGACWAIGKAFWESSLDGLVTKWLIPMVVILGVCMIPSETVYIRDPILGLGWQKHVEHVPLGLARGAMVISSIGHGLTAAIEQVFAVPGHPLYTQVGMIFGAENVLDMAHYAISDENLADSMRDFVENCIVYDLALNYYTMDELKRSPNIWELVKNNTSNVRMFNYCEKGAKKRCQLLSCRRGAIELEKLLKAHNRALEKHHVIQFLPLFYAGLTGIARTTQDLISQQVMMHAFIDAVDRKCDASGLGSNFAVRRAYMQQRHTYEVVGGLAAKALVVLRNVFEALIYASFIFIMPFSLMPLGFRIFLKWLWLLIWIQLWPPFYAILNSGIMAVAQSSARNIIGIDQGLTHFTSTGLHNLALDMQNYAAYASLSVPFIAYALLQGGISSFVHMASSITGVSQGAGSAAAQEQASGNYSYGNVQLGNYSAFNENMLQNQLSPSLSMGAYHENMGTHSATFGSKGMVINESMSQLSFDIQGGRALSESFGKSADHSRDLAIQEGEHLAKSTVDSTNTLYDWTNRMSHSEAFAQRIAHGTDHSISHMTQETLKKAAQWGKKHGFDQQTSFGILMSAGSDTKELFHKKLPFLGVSMDGRSSASQNELYEDAKHYAKEEGLTKNMQSLEHIGRDTSFNAGDEQFASLSQNLNRQYGESENHQYQYEKHRNETERFSQMKSQAESQSLTLNENYNQEFVDWSVQHFGGNALKARDVIYHSPSECDALKKRFIAIKRQEFMDTFDQEESFQQGWDRVGQGDIKVAHDMKALDQLPPLTFQSPVIAAGKQDLEDKHSAQEQRVQDSITQKEETLFQGAQHMQTAVNQQQNSSSFGKVVQNIPVVGAVYSMFSGNTPAPIQQARERIEARRDINNFHEPRQEAGIRSHAYTTSSPGQPHIKESPPTLQDTYGGTSKTEAWIPSAPQDAKEPALIVEKRLPQEPNHVTQWREMFDQVRPRHGNLQAQENRTNRPDELRQAPSSTQDTGGTHTQAPAPVDVQGQEKSLEVVNASGQMPNTAAQHHKPATHPKQEVKP